jgi:hypothetical protein
MANEFSYHTRLGFLDGVSHWGWNQSVISFLWGQRGDMGEPEDPVRFMALFEVRWYSERQFGYFVAHQKLAGVSDEEIATVNTYST